MDKQVRMEILKMTVAIRQCLEKDILAQLEGTYGMNRDGRFEPAPSMPTMQKNPVLAWERQDLETAVVHELTRGETITKAEALVRFAREVAFTYLNRLAALRMMEARGLIQESIGKGLDSSGFKTFQLAFAGITPSPEAGYRRYLELLFDEAAVELTVLFDRSLPSSILFPSAPALKSVLAELNREHLQEIWLEDETVGWIYQYFTPKEQRDQSRKDSPSAPRNSYELSFRNQFYTPNYVVRFLTDNTLGRIWYEMKQDTRLTDLCEYMVRRPNEVVTARAKKDPKEIRVLDPACGSGHFLLYAFDLLKVIYEEEGYSEAEIPGLILEHNLFGIDIDLRATQITSLALYLKAKKAQPRTRVFKTNIVCAEPMPGDAALFKEFLSTLESPTLERLARVVWRELELAAEAGSLLRPEIALSKVIAAEKTIWTGRPNQQLQLLGGNKESAQLFSDVTDEHFWAQAEERLIDLLRKYASQVVTSGVPARRLFARDGLQGIRFVELLRQRYDVVLMNPPFGAPTPGSHSVLASNYPISSGDFVSLFVERGLQLLTPGGLLGPITNRTGFFLSSFAEWRREVLYKNQLRLFIDLGHGVLDTAMVETAAYVIGRAQPHDEPGVFVSLLSSEEKERGLSQAVNDRQGDIFQVCQKSFQTIPGAPLSYWASPEVLRCWREFPRLEGTLARVEHGLSTKDDVQFVRLWYEVSPEMVGRSKSWAPFAKGGAYAPFYSDIHLVVRWEGDGSPIHTYIVTRYPYLKGNSGWVLHPESSYFEPGLTYTSRTTSELSVRILPEGCLFSSKGPAIFPFDSNDSDLAPFLLGLLNSRAYRSLVGMQLGAADAAARAYEIGVLQQTPCPINWRRHVTDIADEVRRCIALLVTLDSRNETSHAFHSPALTGHDTLAGSASRWMEALAAARSEVSVRMARIDTLVDELYDLNRQTFQNGSAHSAVDSDPAEFEDGEDADERVPEGFNLEAAVTDLLSYAIGSAFGRWDIRLVHQWTESAVESPFASIPVSSRGMLQTNEGLPATSRDIGPDYPIPINWGGIIPEDPDHPLDLGNQVRAILAYMFSDPHRVETEARKILGSKDIRHWISNKFFASHIKRYSKSRRKAPIYWHLRSSKKSYGLWLYYPRLTRDTLYTALRDYVEPKLVHEHENLRSLKEKLALSRASGDKDERSLSSRIDGQEDLIQEIASFRDELKSVVEAGYDPDLNDGVLINISPLYKLISWKDAEKCYKELKGGKYPWSAMHRRFRFR